MRRLKILLTDGTSLAALQAISALGRRFVIDVCDPRPLLCPARFSGFVRRTLGCPSFGVSPISFAEFLVRRLKAERYDVLFPTYDQTYLVARFRKELQTLVQLPVPDVTAVEQVHDRANLARLMNTLGLAHVAADAGTPPNTAQAVFQHGRLLAFHASKVRVRGSAGVVARQTLHQPLVRDDLTCLGAHLDWHGALTVEYAVDAATGRHVYYEVHARLGETANAVASGVNLPQWLVRVALADGPLSAMAAKRASARMARTHNVLAALLSTARDTGSRRAIVRELADIVNEKGVYAGSCDELTASDRGFMRFVPAAANVLRLLLWPNAAGKINAYADSHVLTAQTQQVIRKLTGKLL